MSPRWSAAWTALNFASYTSLDQEGVKGVQFSVWDGAACGIDSSERWRIVMVSWAKGDSSPDRMEGVAAPGAHSTTTSGSHQCIAGQALGCDGTGEAHSPPVARSRLS